MKTKLLVVAVATFIGAGAYMHSGHQPRCLLQLFASEKPAVKTSSSMAGLTSNANDPKEKKKEKEHHERKSHYAKGHEHK